MAGNDRSSTPNPFSFIKSAFAVTALFGLGVIGAHGQNTYTYIGGNAGTWIRTTNWSGGVTSKVPGVDANTNTTVDGATSDIAAINTSSTVLSIGINFNTGTGNGLTGNGAANQLITLGAITLATGATSGNFSISNNSTTLDGVMTLTGVTVGADSNVILKNSSSNGLTLANGSSKLMGLALANTTENKVVISGAGDVNIGSIISGTSKNLTLNATGAGKLVLSGVSTYSGATLISSGTLALAATGSINNTSEVSLGTVGTFDVSAKSGGYTVGTLKGSGNVTGALTVSTQLAIGNSAGTANFSSNLTIGSGATYIYEMTGGAAPGAGSADLGDVAGALTITGSILDLVQLGTYTAGNKFTLFAYDGTLTGTFTDAGLTALADGDTFTDAGGVWQILYADSTPGANGGVSANNKYVTITAIPEPDASALLGAFGILGIFRRRR